MPGKKTIMLVSVVAVLVGALTDLGRDPCSGQPITKLTTYVDGNVQSNNILYFIHGFPDNHHMWDAQVGIYNSTCIYIYI